MDGRLINKRKITIAIVDSSSIIRQMLSLLVERDVRFKLFGAFANGTELITNDEEISCFPSVCLLDIVMPTFRSFQTARFLKEKYPKINIFGYSSYSQGAHMYGINKDHCNLGFQRDKWKITQLLDIIYEECRSLN
ncbi:MULTISPECIES: response regulator transcription factor [Sphingobacterium]|uniref:response regulator transcription factor n=1 Tax=Sphingobacterium TaxID=28453 RepID=UPI00104A7C80|nr:MULTISPECIES: response regulator transcription factor [Sphingobacterium]MCW2263162.1 DNA-binding NarL/FixJ family response regulator [Sphingobacterium kitahiroshimense]TCR11854.1 response regulator receiver domain-containing protein [Sphingobacterium sp. JUb78]